MPIILLHGCAITEFLLYRVPFHDRLEDSRSIRTSCFRALPALETNSEFIVCVLETFDGAGTQSHIDEDAPKGIDLFKVIGSDIGMCRWAILHFGPLEPDWDHVCVYEANLC